MRTVLIGFALAWMGLAVHPAIAHYDHHGHHHRYDHRHYRYAETRYESCVCHFGYEENGVGACTPAVSCFAQGGRCRAACPAQKGD